VAQFASKEAIANTPRSPQFADIVLQFGENVNMKTESSTTATIQTLLAIYKRISLLNIYQLSFI
jgi:hypothetical protein